MKKNKYLIKIFNYLNFLFLILFSKKSKSSNNNNYLFIQTGGIGDLVIFSQLMEQIGNEGDNKFYFLINESLISLFSDKSYFTNIIPLKINKFRYNLIYRIKFTLFLRKLQINEVYNLTSARTAWNDSLALCIGAKTTYCNYNNWKTVYPELKNTIHNKYDYVLNKDTFNEYERIENVINYFKRNHPIGRNSVTLDNSKKENFKYDIIISPFSSDIDRDWALENFVKIVERFYTKYKILIVSSEEQEPLAKMILGKFNVEYSSNRFTLFELEYIITNSKLLIGLDSGITHIALKTNIQVIAIIGGGNYGRYLPKPNDSKTKYLFHQLDCFGCEWQCILKERECITKVTVEKVYSAICQILECN